MKKAVLIIAASGFRDEEYFHPKETLEKAGIEVKTASTEKGPCIGKLGGKATSDMKLEEVAQGGFDAVIFVGGPGSYQLFDNPEAIKIAKSAFASNRIVAGICAGSAILARAGILKGKNATSFSGVASELIKAVANYTARPVESDGLIVTADGPASAREFGEKIVTLLN